MQYSLVSFVRSHRLLASVALAIVVLGLGTTVFAITSGDYKVNGSAQVTTTNVTVDKPSTSSGDIMLATIAIHGGSSAVVKTVPSGWHLIASTTNDVNITLLSYWKAVGVSEPSNYQWVIQGQTYGEGAITAYSGVDTSNAVDTATSSVGLSATAIAPGITTSNPNEQIVAVFAVDEGKTNIAGDYFSLATGMTQKFDESNTPFGPSMSLQEATQATAGSVSSKSSSISGGNKARNWAAQQIALKPVVTGITVVASGADKDSGGNYGLSGSVSLNCNGGTMLVASLAGYASSSVGSLTYNGVPLSRAARMKHPTYGAHADIWYLKNPASGNNTLSWTWISDGPYDLSSVGWICTTGEAANPIGPNTTGATDGGGNGVPLTAALTTTADNSLIYASGWEGGGDQSNMAASGTNTTLAYALQNTSVETVMGVYQTTTTAGSYTSGAVWSSNNAGTMAWIEILAN